MRSGPPGARQGRPELHQVIGEATKTVARLSDEVHTAAPDRLEQFPEEARKPLSKLINTGAPSRRSSSRCMASATSSRVRRSRRSPSASATTSASPPRCRSGGSTARAGRSPRRSSPTPTATRQSLAASRRSTGPTSPAIPAADEHILEEPKKSAQTLVERLRLRDAAATPPPAAPWRTRRRATGRRRAARAATRGADPGSHRHRPDLVFLAEKAGLFKFNLKKLLNDYLNDVQVVTEFEDYRRQLLEIFDDVLEKIHRYLEKSEIYIIAHSEGTVVAFMGLLKGLSGKPPGPR